MRTSLRKDRDRKERYRVTEGSRIINRERKTERKKDREIEREEQRRRKREKKGKRDSLCVKERER